ncbi:MAG: aryl-sulfate sulfotransferase [Myxococcota bacterium]
MTLAWLAACTASTDGPSTPTTPAPVPPAPPIAASCAPQPADDESGDPEALRFWCDVQLAEAAPVEVAFAPVDGSRPERVHRSDAPALDHRVGLYLMAADTDYAWTARVPGTDLAVSGTLTTGPLPEDVAFTWDAAGAPSTGLLGFIAPCNGAYVAILDPATGAVLWYRTFRSTGVSWVEAATFTDDGTVLVIAGRSIVEVDPMGLERLRIDPGPALTEHLHHDLVRADGLTYTLFDEEIRVRDRGYLVDGFLEHDAAGNRVAEWHLADHVDVSGTASPYADNDFSHANAIQVDDQRRVWLSLRLLDAIVRVDGDPSSPTFGEIQARIAHPGSRIGPDWTVVDATVTATGGPEDPSGFVAQHDLQLRPDGTVTVFDNRRDVGTSSGVTLSLDEPTRTATITERYPIDQHCDYQGANRRTPTGNPLLTCAPAREVTELDAATGATVWSATLTCSDGFGSFVPRFVPLDGWPG